MYLHIYIYKWPSFFMLVGMLSAAMQCSIKSSMVNSIIPRCLLSSFQQKIPSSGWDTCLDEKLGLLQDGWETCSCCSDEALCIFRKALNESDVEHLLEINYHRLHSGPSSSPTDNFKTLTACQKMTKATRPERGQIESPGSSVAIQKDLHGPQQIIEPLSQHRS